MLYRVLPSLAVQMLLLIANTATARCQSACMPADSQAVYLAGFITEIITTPDDTGLVRTGGFAGLTEADISIVTSGPACARAMRAYDSMANNPNSGRRLYVLKVGRKRFAVQNPTSHPGMINPTIIFTDRFGFVAAFNGP